ncbi:Serine/threonine-protein kinase ppk6 [Diplogelasinospora grovesii]|uniref:non-specific serine/threonine protein kinase n=1 Tax=Diplogelasinospora grovesii TaxID=303347 RepID=A0AAN6NGG0_9PEZI|nr:Serine/threonine-protein kinase ppk6 [Diplogelasinospora grovesii]
MLHVYGGDLENGAERTRDAEERGRTPILSPPPLSLPKNRSTGNLGVTADHAADKARLRFSFDAGSVAAATEYDTITRSSIMTDHDHGLGLSGLRRIRQQHNPMRTPTLPTSPSSRTPSLGALTRSSSLTMMMEPHSQALISPGPSSPTFTEDLSRFPSESLHSFSFAHQSEDFIHNRQNVLKRSIEFMKDRMGWSAGSNSAAMASAQARVTGDVDMQNMLDLLAKAHLVEAGNLPNGDPTMLLGPLTGPADVSGENLFDKEFIPRTSSPAALDETPLASPTTTRPPEQGWGKENTQEESQENDSRPQLAPGGGAESESSSRTASNQSGTTATTSPPVSRRPTTLKRTLTDTVHVSMQQKLMDAMAKPFILGQPGQHEQIVSPTSQSFSSSLHAPPVLPSSSVHGHSTRWVPAAQAIFTTESKPPWTIMAANDLACLVFGVTKAEVRKMSILEVVQDERRAWLERKLRKGFPDDSSDSSESEVPRSPPPVIQASSLLGSRAGGITAKLLSKPPSRSQTPKNGGRRPATVHSGDLKPPKPGHSHHSSNQSRGVLLCGDVVPTKKKNGATGSASLWVKEKRVGLIWVLEEIHEDVAFVSLDEDGTVLKLSGAVGPIWGNANLEPGIDIGKLVPRIPRQGIDPRFGEIDYAQVTKRKYFTCRNCDRVNIPATIEQVRGATELRVSSFPHIAGIIVVDTTTLTIKSSNSVFCGALFGHEKPDGMSINSLVPDFDKILRILTDEDGIRLVDGIVVPEHSFRKASAFLALKEGRPDAATSFLRPEGLPAKHRDGSELKIDVQMRVVKSEKQPIVPESVIVETSEDDESTFGDFGGDKATGSQDRVIIPSYSEMVFALWITYSRHLHATRTLGGAKSPGISGEATPLHQPSPGQTPAHTPFEIQSDSENEPTPVKEESTTSLLTRQLKEAALTAATAASKLIPTSVTSSQKTSASDEKMGTKSLQAAAPLKEKPTNTEPSQPPHKKTIDDFVILEEMGQGAYGQVKLARYKNNGEKCVLKYVTKRRILVDTWTRDRRLGTVPLEIHVLDYLRRDGFKHANIVEMEDFFEDEVNYYIEMVPHGLPGMDLFDYIELRTNMDEAESRSIFVQVARAIHHLHTKALVVHRDIKDENIILDGEGNIKLIDFGSAAYVKSGPFDVFVGTIDYAAPEVLAGKPYGGKEQDVWALGILLYTIIYKENPFYSIDEIMDRDLRVPYIISEESIDLIRKMLNRDVSQRLDIQQVVAHPWCQMQV